MKSVCGGQLYVAHGWEEREREMLEKKTKTITRVFFFFKLNFREREVGEEDKSHNKSKFFFSN